MSHTTTTCDCPECRIERMRARAENAWEAAATGPHLVDSYQQAWIDLWAEMRAENRAYELALLEDREGIA